MKTYLLNYKIFAFVQPRLQNSSLAEHIKNSRRIAPPAGFGRVVMDGSIYLRQELCRGLLSSVRDICG